MKRQNLVLLSLSLLALLSCSKSKEPVSEVSYESITSSIVSSENVSMESETSSNNQESTTSKNTSKGDESSSSLSSSSNMSSSTSSETSSSTTPIVSENVQFTGLDRVETVKGKYFNVFKDVKVFTNDNIDITNELYVLGHVDYSKVGTYELTYCLDTSNRTLKVKRYVDVVEGQINRVNKQRDFDLVLEDNSSIKKGKGENMEFNPPTNLFIDQELLDKPIKTSSWWTTLLTNNYGGNGNCIFTNPLRNSFSDDGVEVTLASQGFTQYWTDQDNALSVAQFLLPNKDLVIKSSSLGKTYKTSVIDYDENSVKVAMRNNNELTDEMVVTLVQGSPYTFIESNSNSGDIHLAIDGTTMPYEFYDLSGNALTDSYKGNALIVKIPHVHVGYNCQVPTGPNSTLPQEPIYQDKYYLINTPSNTSFTFSLDKHSNALFKDKISYKLGSGNYMSIVPLNNINEASYYHQHGYSFIHKSNTSYSVNHNLATVKTEFNAQYSNLLNNKEKPLLALMPHQYKYSNANLTSYNFLTIRGLLKVFEGNSFETNQNFYGMLPTFAKPENVEFSTSTATTYLESLDNLTNQTLGELDKEKKGPYWDAKTFYPLAQGVIFANQLNNLTYQNKFLTKLENLLSDWFTYTSDNDERYIYYNKQYGTLYYSSNAFATASEMSDHHFTHGYLVYAATVASLYDNEFYQNYKDIIKALANDYLNENKDSNVFPYMRTFDTWAGHSWAHGFGSFAEGNNQESSGEALSSHVASYLYGLKSQNNRMIDAAIYGFTTEMNALKQYVFDYDQDIFASNYSSVVNISSILWGGKNTFATWFGLNPNFIYGIHYLPLGQYVSSYAIGEKEHNALRRIYNGYLQRKVGFKDTWFANMWSVEALIDADSALSKFDANKILNDDYPNDLLGAYWNINASKSLGLRTDKVRLASTFVSGDVYLNNGKYKTQILNPTSTKQLIKFVNETNQVVYQIEVEPNTFKIYTLN